jgi:holo-[acyl-carrier protein] synthase
MPAEPTTVGRADRFPPLVGPATRLPRVRVGTDVVEVSRVERLLDGQPGLAERVFTSREAAYCRSRPRSGEHLAARFAAKEAVLKALGTGLGTGLEWTDVEVLNEVGGRPRVRLHGRAAELADQHGLQSAEISLSHAGGLAIAYVAMVCAA